MEELPDPQPIFPPALLYSSRLPILVSGGCQVLCPTAGCLSKACQRCGLVRATGFSIWDSGILVSSLSHSYSPYLTRGWPGVQVGERGWAVPMWPRQQCNWGFRGQGPRLMASPLASCGTWNLGFFLCGRMVAVTSPLRLLVRTSGDRVCDVLAPQLAHSRCSASTQ